MTREVGVMVKDLSLLRLSLGPCEQLFVWNMVYTDGVWR